MSEIPVVLNLDRLLSIRQHFFTYIQAKGIAFDVHKHECNPSCKLWQDEREPMFFICLSSGNAHQCGAKACVFLKEEQDTLTCTVTGRRFEREYNLNPFTDQHMMNKMRLKGFYENKPPPVSSYKKKKESNRKARIINNTNNQQDIVLRQLHDQSKGSITWEDATWYHNASKSIWRLLMNSTNIKISDRKTRAASQMYYFYVYILLDITQSGFNIPSKLQVPPNLSLREKTLSPLKLGNTPHGVFVAKKFRYHKRAITKAVRELSESVSPELKPIQDKGKIKPIDTNIKLVSMLF